MRTAIFFWPAQAAYLLQAQIRFLPFLNSRKMHPGFSLEHGHVALRYDVASREFNGIFFLNLKTAGI